MKDYSNTPTDELVAKLRSYRRKVECTPEEITKLEVGDSWNILYEYHKRLLSQLEENGERLEEIEKAQKENSQALDFILETGLYQEFQDYKHGLNDEEDGEDKPKLYRIK